MKYSVLADVTFSKTFEVEAQSEIEAWEKVNKILEETTRHDICEDVDGWYVSDKSVADSEEETQEGVQA